MFKPIIADQAAANMVPYFAMGDSIQEENGRRKTFLLLEHSHFGNGK